MVIEEESFEQETVDVWSLVDEGHIEKLPVDNWSFYYDETNNYRKFRFDKNNPSGYNVERALTYDFILGGIAFEHGKEPDTNLLMDKLGIQKKNELKAGSILKNGNFLEDIGLERTQIFLKWMLDSNIIVHYSSLNNLYWSIIDLVDETLTTECGSITSMYHKEMKDQLYFFVMNHIIEMTDILQRYGFPNIIDKDINLFSRAISDLILENNYDDTPELFFLELFRQNIKGLRDSEKMIILSGNKPGELISSYEWEYIDALMSTPNAMHSFDHESFVEKQFKKYNIVDNGESYSKYKFVDSKQCRFVQVSDVFIGILSSYFHYADTLFLDGCDMSLTLSEDQLCGICLLKKVLMTSEKISANFQKHMCPEDMMMFRYRYLDELCEFGLIDLELDTRL